MEITEELIEKLKLTPEQLKATKAVYRAMKAAHKLKVSFWDNYGTLTAYNAKRIIVPNMVSNGNQRIYFENSDRHFEASSGDGESVLYYENLNNFFPGNSDDTFYAEII